jgi:hypothetical protein
MKSEHKNQELKDAVKLAAQTLGRLGGLAGTGDSKRRSKRICRAAANARWEAYYNQAESARKKIKAKK